MMVRAHSELGLSMPALPFNRPWTAEVGQRTAWQTYNTMKLHRILMSSALAAFPVATLAAGADDALETVDYSGRLTVAGQPFSGKGSFKFVLLDKEGARLWTHSDNEAPIDEGVPSGSVSLSVQAGVYHVRLGDPGMGMKKLPLASGHGWEAARVGIWFDDGAHGWSFLGYFGLASRVGHAAETATPNAPAAELDDILAETRSLRFEVAELRRQLAGAKTLPAPEAPSRFLQPVTNAGVVTLKEARRPSLGQPDAPLVLVEFTDYKCGYCKRFFEQTFPLLKRDYIDTGKLRFVSRNLPVVSHPQAEAAALALLGATERREEDYWKMRAWLFTHQRDLGPAALTRYAEEAGLNRATLLAGIETRKHGEEIQEDIAAARAAGITGTPSFVLGTSDGQIIRGERITGAKAFQVFAGKIKALLAKAGAPTMLHESTAR
jgi:protein-disulfide isomerase